MNLPNASAARERLTWIDSLKGFAILTVVIGHIAMEYFSVGAFPEHSRLLILVHNCIYSFHMPLFFLISGFVFSLAYIDADGAPKRSRIGIQLGNIGILYLFWNFLSGVARLVFSSQVDHGASARDLLLFPIKAMDPFWYLYILFLCYLLAMLLGKKGLRWLPIYPISLAFCFVQFLIARVITGFTVVRLFSFFFFFLLGILLQQRPRLLDILRKPGLIAAHFAVGLAILAVLVVGEDHRTTWTTLPFWGVVMAYSLCAALFALASRLDLGKPGFLAWLGRYSLEIYVMHCFFTTADRILLRKLPFIGFAANVCINFVIATFVPVLAAAVLKKLGLHTAFFAPVTWWSTRKKRDQAP